MLALLFLDNFAPFPFFFAAHDFYFLVLFIQVSSNSASILSYCFPVCRLYSLEKLIALSWLDFEP